MIHLRNNLLFNNEFTAMERFCLSICQGDGLTKEEIREISNNEEEFILIQETLKTLVQKEFIVIRNGVARFVPQKTNEEMKYVYCVLRKFVSLENKNFLYAILYQSNEANPFTGREVSKLKKTHLDRFDLNSREGIKELVDFIRS